MFISKEWLKEKGACLVGIYWFETQEETDGVKVVKKLIGENRLDWANWMIRHIFTNKQKTQYVTYATKQVAHLWRYKYFEEYKIYKKWVDNGCPESMRAAAWNVARVVTWEATGDTMITKILQYGLKLLARDK